MNGPRSEGGRRTRGELKRGTPGRPLVSVITVVRNAADDVARTIEGVLAQSYENVEYIVVDGGRMTARSTSFAGTTTGSTIG